MPCFTPRALGHGSGGAASGSTDDNPIRKHVIARKCPSPRGVSGLSLSSKPSLAEDWGDAPCEEEYTLFLLSPLNYRSLDVCLICLAQ